MAIAALRNPIKRPESVWYIKRWADELYARSGVSEHGTNPLTWEAFDAWARRTRRDPTAAETDALFDVVTAMQSPGDAE